MTLTVIHKIDDQTRTFLAGLFSPPPAFDFAGAFQRIEAYMSAETDALAQVLQLVKDDVSHIPDTIRAATAVLQGELDAATAKVTADEAEITVNRQALQDTTDALNAIHAQLSGGGATVTPTTEPSAG